MKKHIGLLLVILSSFMSTAIFAQGGQIAITGTVKDRQVCQLSVQMFR